MFNIFSKNSFGLDISDFSVEALELFKSVGKYKIKSYSRIKLEPGLVENGLILNSAKLAQEIKKLLSSAKPNIIKTKNICMSVPDSQVFTGTINLPLDFKQEQIQEAVQNQIPEIFPLDIENVVSNWQVTNANDEEQEVLIAAISKQLHSQYLDLASKLKRKIITLEMESVSSARSLIEDIKSDEGVLLIDLGARTTSISIFDNQGLKTTYNVNIAGQDFTASIAKKLKISLSEAETKKVSGGLDPKKKEGEILLIVQALLQKIIPEVKKSMDYYRKQTNNNISFGYLTGGSSLLPGLQDYFSKNLNIKFVLADPFTNVSNNDIVKQSGVLFSNVVGLAMPNDSSKKWHQFINFINN